MQRRKVEPISDQIEETDEQKRLRCSMTPSALQDDGAKTWPVKIVGRVMMPRKKGVELVADGDVESDEQKRLRYSMALAALQDGGAKTWTVRIGSKTVKVKVWEHVT